MSFIGIATDLDGTLIKYEWDFDGDGRYDWSSSTIGSTTHRYTRTGIYYVTFRVTDNDNATATDSVIIKVEKKEKRFIPGFEAISIIMMLSICVGLLKRQKNKRRKTLTL